MQITGYSNSYTPPRAHWPAICRMQKTRKSINSQDDTRNVLLFIGIAAFIAVQRYEQTSEKACVSEWKNYFLRNERNQASVLSNAKLVSAFFTASAVYFRYSYQRYEQTSDIRKVYFSVFYSEYSICPRFTAKRVIIQFFFNIILADLPTGKIFCKCYALSHIAAIST